MGLGKTMTLVALVTSNPAPKPLPTVEGKKAIKATLGILLLPYSFL